MLRLVRFDAVQRAAHWSNAVLFGICILTALPLYFSQVERLVGRHVLIEQIHVWAGVALPVPLLVSVAGPWGARMRRDLRRINRWSEHEVRRLRSFGRKDGMPADKFNPGQKLNAIFIGGAIVVMLASGSVMEWFGLFPLSWRSGATFVHEVLAFAVVVVVAGHIVMALTHPDSLRSMVRGWVTTSWAEQHAAAWLDEELALLPAALAAGVPAGVSAGGPGPGLKPEGSPPVRGAGPGSGSRAGPEPP